MIYGELRKNQNLFPNLESVPPPPPDEKLLLLFMLLLLVLVVVVAVSMVDVSLASGGEQRMDSLTGESWARRDRRRDLRFPMANIVAQSEQKYINSYFYHYKRKILLRNKKFQNT